jgi:hypothetical protein
LLEKDFVKPESGAGSPVFWGNLLAFDKRPMQETQGIRLPDGGGRKPSGLNLLKEPVS